MVKADLTRDYYGDLELQPGADLADIKKQFKKLALTYHPDRNPGREAEVTSRFQRIQSAHEVLTDPTERTKYDANRLKGMGGYASGSGVRGNPWANAGSEWAPPPKHPTARRAPPQPSAGAQRYKNFETPKQSAYQAAQEGAGARKSTYEAWENMKTKPGPGKTWSAPKPPPRGTPQSGREESNARAHAPPPRSRPGYDDFRQDNAPNTPHSRSESTGASARKGFAPFTPGGDEPAAPPGAYFTQRNRPEPPPREAPQQPREEPPQAREPPPRPPRESYQRKEVPPTRDFPPSDSAIPDPLRGFRQSNPSTEPRVSTPYANHGGERLNPFENANINRSKSTRERTDRSGFSSDVPRTGSSPNLASPHRARSFGDRASSRNPKNHYTAPSVDLDSSSSDDGPKTYRTSQGTSQFAPRPANSASTAQTGRRGPEATARTDTTHGPPLRSGQANNETNGDSAKKPPKSDNSVQDSHRPAMPTFDARRSAENISTKFNPDDWNGKFEAGTTYFTAEQKAAGVNPRSRTQSRGRSPVKPRPIDPHHIPPRVEPEPIIESPGGTKFSPDEWAEIFKPQTFAPPPAQGATRGVPVRKRTMPTLRPTMGTAAVVDDGETSDEKPLFTGRKPPPTPPVSGPDAMDVDTPPNSHVVPQFPTPKASESANINPNSPKRPAPPSLSPVEAATLKVDFEDLKIQDLISSLNTPAPPAAPVFPTPATRDQASLTAIYEDYKIRFSTYMRNWDTYNTQFLLHLVARKNQNESLAEMRWLDKSGIETYRRGLKEDGAVLQRWSEEKVKHEAIVKSWAVTQEGMRSKVAGEANGTSVDGRVGGERPRKKTH